MKIATLIIAAVLVASPLCAAIPDEPIWSSFLTAAVFLAGILLLLGPSGRQTEPLSPNPSPLQGKGSIKAPLVQEVPERARRRAGRLRDGLPEQSSPALCLAPTSFADQPAAWLATALIAWAAVSVAIHALRPAPSVAFLDVMLHGWSMFAAWIVLFLAARHIAGIDRSAAAALLLAVVAGASIAAIIALQEYGLHLRNHQSEWRVFGTSTPDFLAGYLLMAVPINLALVVATPKGNSLRWLLGLVALLQVAAIAATGSRFGLLSLVVGMAVLAVGLWRVRASGGAAMTVRPLQQIGIGIVLLAALAAVARPLLHRLLLTQANSGAFRIWTWRGSMRLALAHPLLGCGPGMYVFRYPVYALAGFTRLAHNSYLQIADEVGFVGLLLVALVVALSIRAAWSVAMSDPSTSGDVAAAGVERGVMPSFSAAISAYAVRIIAAGLVASVMAEALQNWIDSDVYVFAIGATFWSLLGLAMGIAPEKDRSTIVRMTRHARIGLACAAVLPVFYNIAGGVAAVEMAHAREILQNPSGVGNDAQAAYATAAAWAPLSGQYPASMGLLLSRSSDPSDQQEAVRQLRTATRLQPDANNYRRLGRILAAAGDTAGAMDALRRGLADNPNGVDILTAAAQTQPSQAIVYYRRIAALEQTPVGTVRALEDVTDPSFGIADAAVADDDKLHHDNAGAILYYRRAMRSFQEYADDYGSRNDNQMAENGGRTDAQRDSQISALYDQAATSLAGIAPPDVRNRVLSLKQLYDGQFELVSGDVDQVNGDDAGMRTAFAQAIATLSAMPADAPADVAKRAHDLITQTNAILQKLEPSYISAHLNAAWRRPVPRLGG